MQVLVLIMQVIITNASTSTNIRINYSINYASLSAPLIALSVLIVSEIRVGGFVTSTPHVTFESTVHTHPLDA